MRGQAFFGRRNWDILPPQGDETARTREEDALSVVAVMARDEGGNSAERMTGRRLALGSAVVLLLLAALMNGAAAPRRGPAGQGRHLHLCGSRCGAATGQHAQPGRGQPARFLLTSDVRFLGPVRAGCRRDRTEGRAARANDGRRPPAKPQGLRALPPILPPSRRRWPGRSNWWLRSGRRRRRR